MIDTFDKYHRPKKNYGKKRQTRKKRKEKTEEQQKNIVKKPKDLCY